MKYQSVAILGAGAVGSYVMWGLAKKKEIDLCVVASGRYTTPLLGRRRRLPVSIF